MKPSPSLQYPDVRRHHRTFPFVWWFLCVLLSLVPLILQHFIISLLVPPSPYQLLKLWFPNRRFNLSQLEFDRFTLMVKTEFLERLPFPPLLDSLLHFSDIKIRIFPGTLQSNLWALYLLGLCSLIARVGTKLTLLSMHAAIRTCIQICILDISLKTDVIQVPA